MSKETIHIAMATDDNYAKHLGVAICSVVMNLSENYKLCVYVLFDNLSDENKKRIEQLKNIRDFKIEFIRIDCDFLGHFLCSDLYLSSIVFARVYLQKVLEHLDKCIYLDCDLVLRKDISSLWNFDIANNFFGAVEDPFCVSKNRELKIPEEASHFNSGVLLLNLKKLRDFELERKVFEFLQGHGKVEYGDQDVLNALFYGKWGVLPLQWNVVVSMYWSRESLIYYKYTAHEVFESLKDPAICHYTQKNKPNSFLCKHPFRKEYLKYLQFTDWRNCRVQDVSFKSCMIRLSWDVLYFSYFLKRIIKKAPFIFIILRTLKRFFMGFYFRRQSVRF